MKILLFTSAPTNPVEKLGQDTVAVMNLSVQWGQVILIALIGVGLMSIFISSLKR